MASTFPHVTITVASKDDGTDASGELNTLCLGYGFMQAWVYAVLFGSGLFFGTDAATVSLAGMQCPGSTAVMALSLLAFGVCSIILGCTNQLFLKFYVSKRALAISAALMCVGSYASFLLAGSSGGLTLLAILLAGLATGIGSSLMIVMLGTAFSRYEFSTIILNTAVAVAIGLGAYLLMAHALPPTAAGIVTGILPVIVALVLWRLTPIPYFLRREMPIFHPLAVKHAPFLLRTLIPVAVFGFALGAMRIVANSVVLPAADFTTLLVIGASICLGMAITIATIFVAKNEGHWDLLFRTLLPFAAMAALALAFLGTGYDLVACLVLIAGYSCFEALMWIFLADLAQEFRLSPIYVFGIGRGTLALASLIGAFVAMGQIGPTSPSAGIMSAQGALFVIFALIVGYSLSPRRREIKAVVVSPAELENADAGTQALNEELSTLKAQPDAAAAGEPAMPQADGSPSSEAPAEGEEVKKTKGRFHAQCEAIADRYLLSRRETEVLFLLAKGHNASFIQDELCISKSTAKTHINHIYRKLDIHTQQELLNMVEIAKREAADAAAAKEKEALRQQGLRRQ